MSWQEIGIVLAVGAILLAWPIVLARLGPRGR